MKKKILSFMVVLLIILSSGMFSKVTNAAGTAKPTEAGSEASYEVISLVGSQGSGGTAQNCGLFDGTQVNEWNTANVMYWYNSSNYVEINIKEACNIWRSGTSTWKGRYSPLNIYLWDGTQYNDVTSNYTQTTTQITQTDWEKTIPNLQPGRYKFTCNTGTRIDSEWYLEEVNPALNLVATAGNKQISLSWDAVNGATSYNIKRSTTSAGPYTTVATGSAISYIDTNLTNDVTYYYVISVVNSSGESANSEEVFATPTAPITYANAILNITLINGTVKEYSLTGDEINDFLIWYSNRANGQGDAYYIFNDKNDVSPFVTISTYIPFDKILYFDVKMYE